MALVFPLIQPTPTIKHILRGLRRATRRNQPKRLLLSLLLSLLPSLLLSLLPSLLLSLLPSRLLTR
jgi:hypothetical protein